MTQRFFARAIILHFNGLIRYKQLSKKLYLQSQQETKKCGRFTLEAMTA